MVSRKWRICDMYNFSMRSVCNDLHYIYSFVMALMG